MNDKPPPRGKHFRYFTKDQLAKVKEDFNPQEPPGVEMRRYILSQLKFSGFNLKKRFEKTISVSGFYTLYWQD